MTRLGRGLEALIRTGPESIDKTTGITTIKIEHIIPNRFQPRKRFDQEKLQELANSLKENGIIQPIIVTKRDDTQYEIIAGERRFEASKLAGFYEIPVIIRSVSPKEQLQFAIIENVQREDLNAIEEAKAYQQLHDEFELTHSQISDIVGKDRATISNFIRLLKLTEPIQLLILEGKLSPGHARAILQIDENYQEDFAKQIIKEEFSVRKAEIEARKIKQHGFKPSSKTESFKTSPDVFSDYEYRLMERFKTKIKISEKNQKGKISIYYSNRREFYALIKELESEKHE
ncbi:MAG: ParB/RepB/Spo0J family partition protein [Candidatus Cloacimonetes bacterium]|nr:ParB/RepB/Spo0J family partition protein [Candidatus Cloacimonadota bacterium]